MAYLIGFVLFLIGKRLKVKLTQTLPDKGSMPSIHEVCFTVCSHSKLSAVQNTELEEAWFKHKLFLVSLLPKGKSVFLSTADIK